MIFAAVDLGTTNIKVALYDHELRLLAISDYAVRYRRDKDRVEFDPDVYFHEIVRLRGDCAQRIEGFEGEEVAVVLTGQAESFVVIGHDGEPLAPGISWMDMRSVKECEEMKAHFGEEAGFYVTGQPWITPTWTATKLRWLRNNAPQVLTKAEKILLLKDYIQYRFTGKIAGEASVRGFSYLMDLARADYWPQMLEFCGVRREQLPDIVAPCTSLSVILPEIAALLPPCRAYTVNVGALDHFAGMIGSGGFVRGVACESAGTVLSLSLLTDSWECRPERRISCHIGPQEGSYVLFHCCDSGGVCLDWYKNAFLPASSYRDIEDALAGQAPYHAPVFLPYLTGINPPEYYTNAKGAFMGLTLAHRPMDLAYSVMEGVGFLLRSNLEYCRQSGCHIDRLISTGGGAKSAYWSQLKADICDMPIRVPHEKEATCRGAAIIGAVCAGIYRDYEQANACHPVGMTCYEPGGTPELEGRYGMYREYKKMLEPLFIEQRS